MVGDNRIELVPQRTSFEGAKRRANDRERGCRRLYDCREKRKMAIKNPTARSTWNFSLWWAITGSNWFRSEHHLKEQSDAQMIVSADAGGYMTVEKKEKGKKKAPRSRSRDAFFWWAITGSNC